MLIPNFARRAFSRPNPTTTLALGTTTLNANPVIHDLELEIIDRVPAAQKNDYIRYAANHTLEETVSHVRDKEPVLYYELSQKGNLNAYLQEKFADKVMNGSSSAAPEEEFTPMERWMIDRLKGEEKTDLIRFAMLHPEGETVDYVQGRHPALYEKLENSKEFGTQIRLKLLGGEESAVSDLSRQFIAAVEKEKIREESRRLSFGQLGIIQTILGGPVVGAVIGFGLGIPVGFIAIALGGDPWLPHGIAILAGAVMGVPGGIVKAILDHRSTAAKARLAVATTRKELLELARTHGEEALVHRISNDYPPIFLKFHREGKLQHLSKGYYKPPTGDE